MADTRVCPYHSLFATRCCSYQSSIAIRQSLPFSVVADSHSNSPFPTCRFADLPTVVC
ncbi:MAG: hypothetical protein ACO2PK_01675 [Armatimonadota bacterium]